MNFIHLEFLIPVTLVVLFLSFLIYKQEKYFFNWVEDHWFYVRSKSSKVSGLCFILGLFILSLALLDLRGTEISIKGKVSDQKTIVLIDSSASMLAEDVRPNRFEKAILLAKHYIKKAVGQQVSIVVFSDSTKQIIPFTNDVDLLEARLGALERMQLDRGGTSLSLGIKESIQYFKNHTENLSGNILIFTDAEETDGGSSVKIPDGISVGVIGIGTSKGAVIPMRNRKGVFVGNKKFQGKAVVSKLDESFIKSLGENISNFRYWIATSYSLPTEDILGFFSNIHKTKQSKNNFRIRPVLSHYLMLPGLFILMLSFVLKMKNTFVLPVLVLLLISKPLCAKAVEEEKKEKSDVVKVLEKKFVEGVISQGEKKALASLLLKEGFSEEAESLYGEILKNDINDENVKDHFNRGAAQFKSKKIMDGFNTYRNLHDYLQKNNPKSEMLPSVKMNMLKALEQMGQSSKSSKGSKDDKSKDSKNKDSKGDEDKDSKNKDSKGDESKDNKNKDSKNDESKRNQKKDQSKKEGSKSSDKNKNEKNKDKKIDQKGKPNGASSNSKKKLPALLKQLMSDDNQLQKEMIDAGTTERKTREQKDW